MQRYEVCDCGDCTDPVKCIGGSWVKYEEAIARIRELEAALVSIEKEITEVLPTHWLSNLIRARDVARAALRGGEDQCEK